MRNLTIAGAFACLLHASVFSVPSAATHGTLISSCSPAPFSVSAPGTYVLDDDLGPCAGDGIVVTANDVTIDLHGHRIFGSGDSLDMPKAFTGIRIAGASRVLVTSSPAGGQVDRFNAGVLVDSGSTDNVVQNLDVHDNIGQLSALSFSTELGDGILIRSARRTVVQRNTVRHNGPFSGIGVAALTDAVGKVMGPSPVENMIRANVVRGNDVPGLCAGCPGPARLEPHSQEDVGIRLEGPGAQRNLVSRNTVEGNGSDGILVSFVDNTNFPTGSPPHDPPNPENFGNLVVGNTVRANGFGLPGPGAWFPQMTGNGINLLSVPFDAPPNIAPPHHNSVRSNVVSNNRASGIVVNPQAHSNQVAGNVATGNDVGRLPPGGPFGGAYDLEDANDATTAPNRTPCNGNIWTGNTFGTRNLTVTPQCIS